MTQSQLILEYIKEFGSIVPAKQHGFAYKDGFLGSESSKRCREMRKQGILKSEREGKFEKFYLVGVSSNGKIAVSNTVDRGSIPLTPATIIAKEFLKRFPSQATFQAQPINPNMLLF